MEASPSKKVYFEESDNNFFSSSSTTVLIQINRLFPNYLLLAVSIRTVYHTAMIRVLGLRTLRIISFIFGTFPSVFTIEAQPGRPGRPSSVNFRCS